VALPAGTPLGRYEIVSALGAGGMGEVYRARDTRLDRSVAIKVLPADFATDPELDHRFHAEARALSQLSHPHICTLFDFGEDGETKFLVMELLAGETIADRLANATSTRPAFTLGSALHIAAQIADALAAAHQRGIVHRDLKPANVMLTKGGDQPGDGLHAKLLDFGLAKAGAPVVTSLSVLPTTPPQAGTAEGTILGTVQYMAPEQIEGGLIDGRTDIFAFGCVLFEMLTGRKAFEGQSAAAVMAAILERDPPSAAALTPGVPAVVEATIRRCLAKIPHERWQSAADLATALRWSTAGAFTSPPPAASAASIKPRPRVVRNALVAIAALLVGAAGAVGLMSWLRPDAPRAGTIRFEIEPPDNAMWTPAPISSAAQLALAPNGQLLAFVASPRRGVALIWIRSLDAVEARPIAGTEGASFPFWSPDSRHVGFFADGKLKKIDIAGGRPQTLADAPTGRGGSWGPDGILFTPAPTQGLSRVSAEGGPVTVITDAGDTSNLTHYWPQVLGDGSRVMFYQRSGSQESQGVYIRDLNSGATKRVLDNGGRAEHVPGNLLFVRDGMLFTQRFDDSDLSLIGEPVRIADSIGHFFGTFGDASVSASPTGVLAYGPSVVLTTELQWRDRAGAILSRVTAPGVYRSPRLSPSERHLALEIVDRQRSTSPDVWVLELARGALSRFTTDSRTEWFPVWSPDESVIYFGSTRLGSTAIFRKARSGGEDVPLTGAAIFGRYATDITRDGKTLIIQEVTRAGYDLRLLRTDRDQSLADYLTTNFNEVQGRISPNERWLAYASDESGRFEVYVRAFPRGGEPSPISIAGGMQPVWRRDGKELFYIAPSGEMMVLPVTIDGPSFIAGTPRPLFNVEMPESSAPFPTDYTVTADGQRFLVNTIVEQPNRQSLTVVVNWLAQLQTTGTVVAR
jgi:serine/threonine protein kinase/Tol biopolymer transport system component